MQRPKLLEHLEGNPTESERTIESTLRNVASQVVAILIKKQKLDPLRSRIYEEWTVRMLRSDYEAFCADRIAIDHKLNGALLADELQEILKEIGE